ncbi:MAG: DUF1232 domain-containing protein [Bacteroidetes bacterium]|nr:DUF1232 domain-containing protein [Bacteroidota bacterium]
MHLLHKMIPASFRPSVLKAEQLINDVKKVTSLLNKAVSRADKNKPLLKKVWDDLTTLFRLLKAYTSGQYRDIPWRTIILALGAVIYFLNPLDLIPDIIPFFGFVDDSSVIGFVIYSISNDIQKFREWEKNNSAGI